MALEWLEERVATLLDLDATQRADGFSQLRRDHPEHADLLLRWEHAADVVDGVQPAAPEADTEGPPTPGIAGYKILDCLGRGGMGVVYLAESDEGQQRVALKVLRDGLDSSDLLTRFDAEIRALERMDHPAVASIVDSGTTADGRPYIAMEYIPGLAIHEYCDRQKIDISGRIALMRDVCLGVQHAHDRGVLHRDLKPSNILVQIVHGDPEPVIIDFGVARGLQGRLAGRTLFTEHGRMLGTPEYMSPEQAEMSKLEVNQRSDIYSLGAVLYELLTGTLPFPSAELREGGRASIADRLRQQQPMLPSARLAEIAGDATAAQRIAARGEDIDSITNAVRGNLDWVVMRCLEKDPADRYASATALADDLGRFLAHGRVHAGPPGVAARAWRGMRRRGRAGLSAAGSAALVGVAAWLATGSPPPGSRPLGGKGPPGALTRFDIESAARPIYPLFSRRIDFSSDGLRAVHEVGGSPDAPTSLAVWDHGRGQSQPLAVGGIEGWAARAPRWSPGSRRIAFVGMRQDHNGDTERQIFVVDTGGGIARQLLPAPSPERIIDVCWLPDGSGLACSSADGGLFALSLGGTRVDWPSPGQMVEIGSITPNGRWVICSATASDQSAPRDLWVVPTQGGSPRRLTHMVGDEAYACITPDGQEVWFVGTVGSGTMQVASNVFRLAFDSERGVALGPTTPFTNYDNLLLSELALVNGGQDLAWRVRHKLTEVRVRTGDGAPEILGRGSQAQVGASGEWVYFVDWTTAHRALVRTRPSASSELQRLASLDRFEQSAIVFRLGAYGQDAVLCGIEHDDPGVFLVQWNDADTAGARTKRIASTSEVVTPAWSPDGQWLAWIDDERLWAYEVAVGVTRELGPSVFAWHPESVAWSPDGRTLAATAYASKRDRDELDINTVYAIDWPSGQLRRLTAPDDPYKEDVRWHPSGEFLSAIYSHHAVLRINADGSGSRVLLDDPDHVEYRGRWSADGTQFIHMCLGCRGRANIGEHILDVATGSLRLDSGGRTPIASCSADGVIEAWDHISEQSHFEWIRAVR